MRKTSLAAAAWMLACAPATAEIIGAAAVLDGDVIWVGGQRIRLYGIDAPEILQFCFIDGKPWECGPAAIRNLEILVALEPVVCSETGDPADDLGTWAVCTVGGRDLSETMARLGWAVAYHPQSDDYSAAEEAAKAEGVGVWKSTFLEPWVFREDQRAVDDRIAERLQSAAMLQLERALVEGTGGIDVFQGFQIVQNDSKLFPLEYEATEVDPRYMLALDPALELVRWRNAVVEMALGTAAGTIWTNLAEHPRIEIETEDAATYLQAVEAAAAPLTEAGRKPVLLVRSINDPEWIEVWFDGERPAGMEIAQKDDIASNRYMGTVNGIDVYRASLDEGQSMLIPADLLKRVTYGTNRDGHIVNVERTASAADELRAVVFRFSQAIEWADDEGFVFKYPFDPVGDLYDEE